jgi:hypothetical protein
MGSEILGMSKEMGMTEIRGNRVLGRRALVVVLSLVVGLAVAGPASAGVVQNSPADKQYGGEQPTATSNPSPEVESEVFLPPTVASAGQEDSSLLPFTGAALIVPSVLGGLLLAGGLFLVYRTRRRET